LFAIPNHLYQYARFTMPRSRRSAPARRAAPAPAAPQRSAAPPMRSTQPAQPPAPTTAAHPPAPVSQGPGLFGQMASTAAGVAVGSAVGHTIGHGLTSMFGGGSSSSEPQAAAPAQEPAYQPSQAAPYAQQQPSFGNAAACEVDAKAFAQCMTNNNHDVNACQWYLDMLKQCQASSAYPSSGF
ncbi:hypothetical protein H4R35_006302, partial [Dimargaris xerosporica]